MNPTVLDLNFFMPLTTIGNNWLQNQQLYAADKVFPIIPTDALSGSYYEFNRGDWFRAEARERGPAAESAGTGFRISNRSIYTCRVYALHSDIDRYTLAIPAAGLLNIESATTEFVMQNLMLQREQKWANTFFTTGVWGRDRVGVAAGPTGTQFLQFNDVNSDPISVLRSEITFIQATQGLRPNVLVMGQRVFDVLIEHPDMIERVKYVQAGVVPEAILASLLAVDRIVVANPIVNSAAEGATDAFDFMYGKHMLLVYANPNANIQTPSGGYIFAWNGYLPGNAYTAGVRRIDLPKENAIRIEGETAYDMKVVTPSLGTFFQNVVA